MSTLFSHFFTKINKISPLDADFTEVLEGIAVMPEMLYFYGEMPKNVIKKGVGGSSGGAGERPKCVGIVGSRRSTRYGEEVAYRLAGALARRGVVVVSGLAMGIDAMAHRGALDGGGVTVSVLGTAIDRISPQCNRSLAERIVRSGGCVMSEYGPGAKTYSASFLERNRLISGLSDVVVVVEAAVKSGALNTAMHAIEQGRELLAVPGDITRATATGCNKLIRQGAMPFTEVDDVLSLLFPPASRRQSKLVFGDNPEETGILGAISRGVQDGEAIIEELGMNVSVFNQTITILEIKGRVRGLGANRWCLRD